eukprot:3917083-Rhodomonas_salina.1
MITEAERLSNLEAEFSFDGNPCTHTYRYPDDFGIMDEAPVCMLLYDFTPNEKVASSQPYSLFKNRKLTEALLAGTAMVQRGVAEAGRTGLAANAPAMRRL